MSNLVANFGLATAPNAVFQGTSVNDAVLYTTSSNNAIWIGCGVNTSNSTACISSTGFAVNTMVASNLTTSNLSYGAISLYSGAASVSLNAGPANQGFTNLTCGTLSNTGGGSFGGMVTMSNLTLTGSVVGFNGVSSNQSFSNIWSSNVYGSNAAFGGLSTFSNINFTGSLTQNGAPFTSGGSLTFLTGNQFGTSNNPINGGSLSLDTTQSLSAIVELSSNVGALNINLSPGTNSFLQFNANTVGNNGTIVIVERRPGGRSISIDPRIHFSTGQNGMNTSFSNIGFYSSTLSNFTTTSPPALGGFAVDTISYYIPKAGFALGSYNRMFSCMPPALNTIPTSVTSNVYTGSGPLTIGFSNYYGTYSNYYGPLAFDLSNASGSPVIPSGMSVSGGVLTVNQGVGYIGNANVSVYGVSGMSNFPLSFGIVPTLPPYVAPVIVAIANQSYSTLSSSFTLTPTASLPISQTGSLTWSVTSSPSVSTVSVNSSSGALTVAQGSSAVTTLTLTASGPTGLSSSVSFGLGIYSAYYINNPGNLNLYVINFVYPTYTFSLAPTAPALPTGVSWSCDNGNVELINASTGTFRFNFSGGPVNMNFTAAGNGWSSTIRIGVYVQFL